MWHLKLPIKNSKLPTMRKPLMKRSKTFRNEEMSHKEKPPIKRFKTSHNEVPPKKRSKTSHNEKASPNRERGSKLPSMRCLP